jgi:formate hydrogenlyase subunit 6/NADH:ubiquinone oxidoreductase subunit I
LGILSSIKAGVEATWSGMKHVFRPRMTLRYPEQKLDLEGPGYKYDPKRGVGLPGFKGRHILYLDKCTGCQLCAIACDGIAVAIDMQFVQKNKPQNKKNIWPAVDYGRCLPPWTPILTINGPKPISEVGLNDQVLTHLGRFRRVTQIFRRRYSGKTYTFSTLGNPEPLTVTEEHPVLIYDSGETKWVTPDKVQYRMHLTRPIIKETMQVENLTYEYELYHQAGRGGYSTVSEVRLPFTPELARLIGFYLAEGNADRYRVTFDIDKKEQHIADEIRVASLKAFQEDISVKPDKRSGGPKLVIDSVRVASFFQQFGTSCDAKFLPNWFFTLPASLQFPLVAAAFTGDGHYFNHEYEYMRSNYFTLRTNSKTLATQVLHVLPRLGIVAPMSKQDQKDRKRCYSVTIHTPYMEKIGRLVEASKSGPHSHSYIKMTDDMVISPITSVHVEHVQDFEVMNLEVEDDHSYVASNQIVHNCVFCGLCIDPSTPVITNPDLKPVAEIVVGEMVLTHSGEYKPVTKVWDMRYTGPLYRIYAYGRPEPLICTADHPVLAVSRPVSTKKDKRLLRVTEPLKFYKPEELKRGDYLIAPIVKKEVPIAVYSKEVPMYRGGTHKKLLALDANPELFRLIGYYLAEGTCDGGRTVNFDFNATERNSILEDCKKLLEGNFRRECKIRKNGNNGLRLVLDSAVAEDFFSQFGKGAPNKKIPSWAFFAEKPKILELLKGYWHGDGARISQPRQKYFNFTTTSKTLAFQVHELLAKLGIVSLIEGQHQKDRQPSYHVNIFGRWAIKLAKAWRVDLGHVPKKHADKFHLTENYVFLPIRKIEVSKVDDYRVMDVTVEDDHTFAPLGLATSNCVDACPFDALFMTNDYELSAYDKSSLKFTPDMLALPPKTQGETFKVKIDPKKGVVTHG